MKLKATLFICILIFIAGCSGFKKSGEVANFPLDDLEGVIDQSHITFDKGISADGKGSLRIDATEPVTVPLFEVRNIDFDNARLLYQAKVRVDGVIGQVYLEMLCHFGDKGEFFSRGQATLLSGTTDWTSQETPFSFQKGETPDYVKLNLVINGTGAAWIDDIKLIRAPLEAAQ